MTGGILVEWEGIACQRATFRRGRGLAADLSEVVFPVSSFPGSPVLKPDLRLRRPPKVADVAGVVVDLPRELAGLPATIPAEGTLTLAQVLGAQAYKVSVPNLFVVRVDSIERDAAGEAMVRLTLADERLFWARGLVKRWSFNRALLDGTRARDSEGQSGALTREEILRQEIAPSLFRSPKVTSVPASWRKPASFEFAPWEQATRAIADMLRTTPAQPCLRLDGTLAIHEEGDGKDSAYAQNGVGANTTPVPPEVWLDEEGTGQGYSVEQNYPPDYVLVVGLPRVATVALDDWEPVVMVKGEPFLLSEEFLRKVTGNRFGLQWLRKFVLAPSSEQARVDLPEDVLELLRSQAYRLFRMPGVELVEGGFYTGSPGPNAHLVPLLDRAETQGPRRQPPTIESYRYVQRHWRLSVTAADQGLIEAAKRLAELKRLVFKSALRQGVQDPLSGPLRDDLNEAFVAGATGTPTKARFVDLLSGSPSDGLDWSTLASMLNLARRVDSVVDVDPSLGEQYSQALAQKFKAESEVKAIHFELAKQLRAIERDAVKIAQPGDGSLDVEAFRNRINAAVKQAADKAKLEKRKKAQEQALTGSDEPLLNAVAYENLPRDEDAGARVYSKELGVVRTGSLAGHLVDPDVPSQDMTSLQPCPVRVVFGAEVRPRLDRAPPVGSGVLSGPVPTIEPIKILGLEPTPTAVAGLPGELGFEGQGPLVPFAQACAGGDNAIPSVLTDQATHYTAAFKRSGKLAVPIPLEQLPLNQAVRVARPWRELIPLEGESNRGQLDEDALAEANLIVSPPEQVAGWRRAFDGPWPIQCDGVVAFVEITTDLEGEVPVGFTTRVAVGVAPPEAPDPRKTIVRRRPDAGGEGAKRVGADS